MRSLQVAITHASKAVGLLGALAGAAACGGGDGVGDSTRSSAPSPPGEDPDWTISVTPPEITISPRDRSTVTVALSRSDLRAASVEAEGYPPSNIQFEIGVSSQRIALNWLDDAPAGDYEIQFVAKSAQSKKTPRAVVRVHQLGDRPDLDLSFGTNGIALTPFTGLDCLADALRALPDGSLRISGRAERNAAPFVLLGQLDTAGKPDLAFGTDGYVGVQLINPAPTDSYLIDTKIIAVDATGRTVVPARVSNATSVLMRYLPDGLLDESFGTKGSVTIPHYVDAMALDSSGNTLTFGNDQFESQDRVVVSRLLPSGALDTTFADGGSFLHDHISRPIDIRVTGDGRPLVHVCDPECKLVRLDPTGVLDASFGAGGVLPLDKVGSSLLELLPNGGYSFVTSSNLTSSGSADEPPRYAITFRRTHSNGDIDGDFGVGGSRTTEVRFTPTLFASGGGFSYVVGMDEAEFSASTEDRWAVARFSSSGELDSTFGRGGISFTAIRSKVGNLMGSAPSAAAVQSDGKLVLAGTSDPGGLFLVRYR